MEKKEGKGKKLGIYVENGLEYGVGVILEEVVTHERIVRKKKDRTGTVGITRDRIMGANIQGAWGEDIPQVKVGGKVTKK